MIRFIDNIILYFFTFSFWISLPTDVKSQPKAVNTASLNITATVLDNYPLQLNTLNNMYIRNDMNEETDIYISPVASAGAGLMRASGKPNALVRMTCLLKEIFPEDNGNGRISVYYELSGNDEWVQEASTIIDKGESVFTLNNKGFYYLWIGGFIDLARAGPGRYRGQFTMEIEYI